MSPSTEVIWGMSPADQAAPVMAALAGAALTGTGSATVSRSTAASSSSVTVASEPSAFLAFFEPFLAKFLRGAA